MNSTFPDGGEDDLTAELGELVDRVSTIGFGSDANAALDILGQVCDPCCGSGGSFGGASIYGQESNSTTWLP